MTAIVFYFQVHQPYRLSPYRPEDVGAGKPWFDDGMNRAIVRRVAARCYHPMNRLLLEQIRQTDGRFRCSFSLSGTVIQQLRDWAPRALESFVTLAETGCVEFLSETSHHSLASVQDPVEFTQQVEHHRDVIEDLFGRRPTTFRNTELCIDEPLARRIEAMGFEVLLGEGADQLLGRRSSEYVYRPRGCSRLKLLLRNYVFSDDIAFRFSNREWNHYPLFADTFAGWLGEVPERAPVIGLFMDYETFGEHQSAAGTGVLEFMRHLPGYVLENERLTFATPHEVAARVEAVAELAIPRTVSWADEERNLAAWLGNPMQQAAQRALYELADEMRAAGNAGRPELLEAWRKLTTSDHVYYMCTKFEHTDADVHEYFTPYESPHESFVRFMSVLDDVRHVLRTPVAPPVADASPDEAPPKKAEPRERRARDRRPGSRSPRS